MSHYGHKPRTFFDSLFLMAKRATEIAPNNGDAWADLAYQHLVKGEYDEGIRLSKKALTLSPNSPGVLNTLGLLLRNDGQLDEAIPLFEKGSILEPRRAQVYQYNLGMSYLFLEMYDEAEKHIQSSVRTGRAMEINYDLLGTVYAYTGEKSKVKDCIDELLKISDNISLYDKAAGTAFYGELSDSLVRAYVLKVVTSGSYSIADNFQTSIALCYLLRQQGQLDSMSHVLDQYEKECRQYYNVEGNSEFASIMTEVEMLRGNEEKALEWYEKALGDNQIPNYILLKHNRLIRPLQSHPKYLELANKMEQKMQQQRMNLSMRNTAITRL